MDRIKKLTLFFFVLTSFTIPLFGQSTANTPKSDPNLENHEEKEGQDKELFEYYYKTRPENLPPNKAKLEYNLIKTLKKEILSRDYSSETLNSLKKIDATNIKYERVYRESKWLRGYMVQNTHLKYGEFMYVAKYDKYMCFMSFDVNPESYLQQARHSQLVFEGKDKFEITIPKP